MTAAVLAAAVAMMVVAAPRAEAWSEFGEREPAAGTGSVAIREPFFALMLELADADSLGQWPGDEVRRYVRDVGRRSNFPLDEITALVRARPDPVTAAAYAGRGVRAVWRIRLRGDQDFPLPYSILGYHPGSLRLSRELVLDELAATATSLTYREDDVPLQTTVEQVRIFALREGHMLLDADGLVDALLGSLLDDSWVLGFVTGRGPDKLLGVGVFLGRDGRRIFGEFDFAADRVLPHGGELAAALSRHSRRWLDPALGRLPAPWSAP